MSKATIRAARQNVQLWNQEPDQGHAEVLLVSNTGKEKENWAALQCKRTGTRRPESPNRTKQLKTTKEKLKASIHII